MAMVPREMTYTVAMLDDVDLRNTSMSFCRAGDTDRLLSFFDEDPEKTKLVLGSPLDAEGRTGLHLAAAEGHLRLCQELVARGCGVDATDLRRQTPLHHAAAEDHAELVLELLVANADVDAVDDCHQTALHKAALVGDVESMRVLLEHGADGTIRDITGSTPMLLAAGHGRIEQVAALCAKDPGLAHDHNDHGWSPLHLAAHGMEMKKSSLKGSKFLPVVRLLLEAKALADAVDEDTRTPLHRAAATGNVETAGALIAAKANVMASDITRWTPLHFACQDGHVSVAKLLLDARAAVQREEPPCLTPLALATMENQAKVAELLLKRGADPNLRGRGLASAAMIARKEPEKYNDILALFELGFVHHAD